MKNENERCGSCTFWYKLPGDPINLAAPKVGVCRARPPIPVVVGAMQSVQGTALNIEVMQTQVREETPCCGLYERRLELAIAN